MTFNDTTNLSGIIQLCEDYCNLGNTGISGNTNLLKKFTAYANDVNREVWTLIFDAYGGWQYDDSNQTDLPIATATITDAQSTYALPDGTYTVRQVEVMGEDSIWHKLEPLATEKISGAISEFYTTDGQPRYYTLTGNTLTIYPAPDYTQASSLRVHFDRGSHDFVATDTTATPGFISEFHGIIPVGASVRYWFSKPQGNDAYAKLEKEFEKLKQNIKTYYSKKFQEMFPPRMTVRDYLKENV